MRYGHHGHIECTLGKNTFGGVDTTIMTPFHHTHKSTHDSCIPASA